MMDFINTVVALALFVGLPALLVFKLYLLLAKTLAFNREQKELYNRKRMQYMDAQILEIRSKIEFYQNIEDQSPADRRDSVNKGGGKRGNYQKDSHRNS